MTTIAYRDGIMAADTQCTWADTTYRVSKLVRLPCGGMAGGCGRASDLQRAFAWFKAGCKGVAPKVLDTFLLIAFGDGRVCITTDKKLTLEPVTGPAAVGSGQQAAIACMRRFGVSALEAVEAAATVDPSTSGPFEVMAIQKPAARKRAK